MLFSQTSQDYEKLGGALERENAQKSELVQKINEWISGCPAAQFLQEICKTKLLTAYFFGGVCRDCWNNNKPRDIDIVVDDHCWEDFLSRLDGVPKRINSFGGTKFTLFNTEVDLWKASNTWAFKHSNYPISSATLLPETTFLNIESVVTLVWHPEEPWVFQKGFFQAMESKTLEIQNPINPNPALCIARARRFIDLGWRKGESVQRFEGYHKEIGLTEKQISEATKGHYKR